MRIVGRIGLCLLVGAIHLLITPNLALACTCDLPQKGKTLRQEISEAREKSKAVFVGKVVEVVSDPRNFYVVVKFKVESSWKQGYSDEVAVRTGRGGGDCGYHFEAGESYLVYAYSSEAKKLETNICQRTRGVADATDDLRLLGKRKPLVTNSSPSEQRQNSKATARPMA